MCKVLIVYYSMYGHVYRMAEAMAEGVREVDGCDAVIKRVPETLSDEVLGMMGAVEAQKGMAHIWLGPMRSSSVHRHVSATCAARCASSWMPPAGSG
jgi:hypothetical protein